MSSKKNETVITVIQFIEHHLTDKLDLNKIADAVHYSKYHLHRIFTETVGISIHDYVLRRQMTEAAKLLIFSKRPILEIALISGYESQQAFTDSFKALYKISPHQFRKNEEFYPLQLRFELHPAPAVEAFSSKNLISEITYAQMSDIPALLQLVHLVIDGYPCFIESDFLKELEKYIAKKYTLMLRDGELAVGLMMFCPETGSIDFLGVHPQYRETGIARAFLDKVMCELMQGDSIHITTFRDGDKADTGYREKYKNLGFAESELLMEYGYPTQKFILSASDRTVSD